MSRVPNKKKLYSQRATSLEKSDLACHVNENAQLAGLLGIPKQKKLQGRNLTKKFYRGKNQK